MILAQRVVVEVAARCRSGVDFGVLVYDWTERILNEAPEGSFSEASRPYGVSVMSWVTEPPSDLAAATVVSGSSTCQ